MGLQRTSYGTPVGVELANVIGDIPQRVRSDHIHAGTRLATGTYTGNGGANQAIAGLGFQPRCVIVTRHENTIDSGFYMKNDQMGVNAVSLELDGAVAGYWYAPNIIISLDADGFTVGNLLGVNLGATDYSYQAWGP